MLIRVARPLFLLTLVVTCAAPDTEPDSIPGEVRRRLAQAVWPENLFDSAGQPERGFEHRAFRPKFPDLQIRRVPTPEALPGVTLFVGQARPSGCAHCLTVTYVVAQRDSVFRTLLSPNDIQYLAGWIKPEALRDSSALREIVKAALRATCFIGCDVKQIHRRSELSDTDSPFLRAEDQDESSWRMPRTYSWHRGGGVLVEFALHSPGLGVYAVRAESDGGGRMFVSISPVARYVL